MNLRLAVVLVVMAFGGVGIYYVLPSELQAQFSPVLLVLVIPLLAYALTAVPLAILSIILLSIITIVARRKIKAAARRLGTTSPYDISKETGIDLEDIVPILDRLMLAGPTVDDGKKASA
jgi:hypothetical protein